MKHNDEYAMLQMAAYICCCPSQVSLWVHHIQPELCKTTQHHCSLAITKLYGGTTFSGSPCESETARPRQVQQLHQHDTSMTSSNVETLVWYDECITYVFTASIDVNQLTIKATEIIHENFLTRTAELQMICMTVCVRHYVVMCTDCQYEWRYVVTAL